MIHCKNENVELYEARNKDLGALLREVADVVDKTTDNGAGWHSVVVMANPDDYNGLSYTADLYVHS